MRLLREARGWTIDELLARVADRGLGLTYAQLQRIEAGGAALRDHQMPAIAAALGCDIAALLLPLPGEDAMAAAEGAVVAHPRATVPVTHRVAAAELGGGVDPLTDHPHPLAPLPPNLARHLADGADLFAAEVADDSADRRYPPGTLLYARAVRPNDRVPFGAWVLALEFVADRADGAVLDVLAGRLSRTDQGDVLLLCASSNRRAPNSVTLRPAPRGDGVADFGRGFGHATPLLPDMLWQPRQDDRADLVGVIVAAVIPEDV